MIELVIGGLIHHVQDVPNIKRTQFQKNVIIKADNINLLVGNNSIGKPIAGFGYDVNLGDTKHNFKVGAYYQDAKEFRKVGVYAPTIMPVLGLEFNFDINDNIYLSQFISPIITFTGIGVRF